MTTPREGDTVHYTDHDGTCLTATINRTHPHTTAVQLHTNPGKPIAYPGPVGTPHTWHPQH